MRLCFKLYCLVLLFIYLKPTIVFCQSKEAGITEKPYDSTYDKFAFTVMANTGFAGFTENLAQKYSTTFTLGGGFCAEFGKLIMQYRISAFFGKTKQQFYTDTVWEKGINHTTGRVEFSLGYNLFESRKFACAPIAGLSFGSISGGTKRLTVKDKLSVHGGFYFDFFIWNNEKKALQDGSSGARFNGIRLMPVYYLTSFKKTGNEFAGNIFAVNICFVSVVRKLR